MSGLTTTGSTVVADIEGLPRSLLLWRALAHWLGGLGIVVLFVAVLPMLGVGGKRLFRFETPGPSKEGVTPRIQETARVLWIIYVALTAAQIISLRLAGMSWFDSTCHTFATLATGGFSTRNASVGAFDSSAVDYIIVFFMLAAGVNFGLYYRVIRGQWRSAVRDPELRTYLALFAVGGLVVVGSIMGGGYRTSAGEPVAGGIESAMRYGLFNMVTTQTCTGFATADYDAWSFAPKAVMILLMYIGGCAGSTSGGLKVVRVLTAAKILWAELERVFRPNVVRPVKVGESTLDADIRQSTLVYIVVAGLIVMIGSGSLIVIEGAARMDVTTAVTATMASFCNCGPGLAKVGPVCNYEWMGASSKYILSVVMVLGRLEVFTLAVLLLPRFWKPD